MAYNASFTGICRTPGGTLKRAVMFETARDAVFIIILAAHTASSRRDVAYARGEGQTYIAARIRR